MLGEGIVGSGAEIVGVGVGVKASIASMTRESASVTVVVVAMVVDGGWWMRFVKERVRGMLAIAVYNLAIADAYVSVGVRSTPWDVACAERRAEISHLPSPSASEMPFATTVAIYRADGGVLPSDANSWYRVS
ncbi:hypothetical protein BSKO_12062 [Bryopsis sp. KO-2023]|nr:hypothetical protein BSKO_12062 [Bryopsis sp. KO-2023]